MQLHLLEVVCFEADRGLSVMFHQPLARQRSDRRLQLRDGAPVPAPLPIEVLQPEPQIAEMVAELDRHPELAFAEHIAEEQRAASSNECAERSPARAQVRLSDRLQRQVCGICPRLRRFRRRHPETVFHDGCQFALHALNGRQPHEPRRRTIGDALARQARQVCRAAMNFERVVPALVDGEDHDRRVTRNRQRGARRRKAGDSPWHLRNLVNAARRQIEPIDVADATRIGDEIQAVAILRPLWIHVLGRVNRGERTDGPGRNIEHCELTRTESQRGEIG